MAVTKRTLVSRRRKGAPIGVSIGPMPEWSHLGISSIVPAKRLMLVPSQDTDVVGIVDLEELDVVHNVKLPKGSGPWHVKATPDGKRAFVSFSRFRGHIDETDKRDSFVGIIDLRSGRLTGKIKVQGGPVMIEMDRRRQRAYVTNRLSNTVSVIDLKKNVVVQTLETGRAPFWISLTPKADLLVVGNFEDASLSIFDASKLRPLATVPVGKPSDKPFPEFGVGDTIGFSIDKAGVAYVANWRSHTVATVNVYEAAKPGAKAKVSIDRSVRSPFHVEIDPRTGLMVVGSYELPDSRVVVFDKAKRGKAETLLGAQVADVPTTGVKLPTGRAAAINYWMSQPFESRVIGFLGQGRKPINPIDLVAAVL